MEQMHLQDQYLEFVRAMSNAGWVSDTRSQGAAKPEKTLETDSSSNLKK